MIHFWAAGIHSVQLPPQKRQGVVAIPQPGPDVYLPSQAPTGAAIAPAVQHGPHGFQKTGIAVFADQVPGEQPAQR